MTYRSMTGGLTLVELMVVIAIISISLIISVPLTTEFVQHQQKEATRNAFLAAFRFARSSAIEHRSLITACTLSPSGTCADTWGNTISVFRDGNGNASMDAGDTLIRSMEIDLSQWSQASRPAGRAHFQWNNLGLSHGTAGSIELCSLREETDRFAIIVSFPGRVRSSWDFDGDGTEERSPGVPVSC